MPKFIAYDATQMGTQTAAALLCDTPTASLVNMTANAKKADVYSTIAKAAEKIVEATSDGDLQKFYKKHKDEMFNREVFKKPTMTVLYGAGVKTFEGQLVDALFTLTGEKLNKPAASQLAVITFAALKEVIPAPIKLMKSLTGIVKKVVETTGEPFVFTTATGSEFTAAKNKSVSLQKVGRPRGYSMKLKFELNELHPMSTAKSAAAQYIQSFDAAIAGEIQKQLSFMGVPVLSVFDSWSVPADKSDVLLEVARDAYLKFLSKDHLPSFYENALYRYPFLSNHPELFLSLGSYDIKKELMNSKLFICL